MRPALTVLVLVLVLVLWLGFAQVGVGVREGRGCRSGWLNLWQLTDCWQVWILAHLVRYRQAVGDHW